MFVVESTGKGVFTKFAKTKDFTYLCATNLLKMEIKFDKKYLEDLYLKGVSSDKKHRFQPQIVKKYVRVIDILRAAFSTDDLLTINSLNYESLKGDKKGIESVRVNDQYRIEFKTAKITDETIVTVCNILELSNHYK